MYDVNRYFHISIFILKFLFYVRPQEHCIEHKSGMYYMGSHSHWFIQAIEKKAFIQASSSSLLSSFVQRSLLIYSAALDWQLVYVQGIAFLSLSLSSYLSISLRWGASSVHVSMFGWPEHDVLASNCSGLRQFSMRFAYTHSSCIYWLLHADGEQKFKSTLEAYTQRFVVQID